MSHVAGRAVEVQSDSLRATRSDSLGVTPLNTPMALIADGLPVGKLSMMQSDSP